MKKDKTAPKDSAVGKAVAPAPKLMAYQPQFVHALRAMLGRRPHDDVAGLVTGLERSGVPVQAEKQQRLAYPQPFVQAIADYLDTTGTHREVRPFLDGLEHGAIAVDAPPPKANP